MTMSEPGCGLVVRADDIARLLGQVITSVRGLLDDVEAAGMVAEAARLENLLLDLEAEQAEVEDLSPAISGAAGELAWPDGKPVTSWADPWGSAVEDVRDAMTRAASGEPLGGAG